MRKLILLCIYAVALAPLAACQGSASGNASVSIVVAPPAAPVITGPTTSAVTDTQATLNWTTDVLSDSQICRGPHLGPYTTCVTLDPSYVTTHAQTFLGLTQNTTYYAVAKSTGAGGLTTSSEINFTTAVTPVSGTPCGELNTNAVRVPVSWSKAQPNPAAASISTIGRDGAGLGTVTFAADPGFVTGTWVNIAGVTDSSFNVQDLSISAATYSGTTYTVTVGSGHNVTTATPIAIEGFIDQGYIGGYLPSSVAATTVSYVGGGHGSTTPSVTGAVMRYAVMLTKVNATTYTYAAPGSVASSSGGTVTSTRVLEARMGSSYLDANYGCSVTTAFNRAFLPNQGSPFNIRAAHDYAARKTPSNLDRTLEWWVPGTGGSIVTRLSDQVLVVSNSGNPIGTQATSHFVWNRNAGGARQFFRRNPSAVAVLQLCTIPAYSGTPVTPTCTTEHDFAAGTDCAGVACAAIGIGGKAGDGGVEGWVSPNGKYLPVVGNVAGKACDFAAPNRSCVLLPYNTVTHAIVRTVDMSRTDGDIDWMDVFDSDDAGTGDAFAIRWRTTGFGNGGTGAITSLSLSGTTLTAVVNGHNLVVGDKIRLFRCSTANLNQLYTVATVTDANNFTATGGASATASGTSGCSMGTPTRGMVAVINGVVNPIEPLGSHSAQMQVSGINTLFMSKNSGNGPAKNDATGHSCQNNGVVGIMVEPAHFTDTSARYDEAQTCMLGLSTAAGSTEPGYSSFGGGHVGADQATQYIVVSDTGCGSWGAVNPDASLAAGWATSWLSTTNPGNMHCEAITLIKADGSKFYTLAQDYRENLAGGYWIDARATFDGYAVYYDTAMRTQAGTEMVSAYKIVVCDGNLCN